MKIAVVVPTIRERQFLDFIEAWRPLFQRHEVELFQVCDGEKVALCRYIYMADGVNGTETFRPNNVVKKPDRFLFNFNDGVRNIGFLAALKLVKDLDVIITLDDDVYPAGNDPIQEHLDALNRRVPISWFSTASEYMRGFPYGVRSEAEVWVSHGVWTGVHDYDGPTQLVNGVKPATFYKGPIPRGVYTPVCFHPDQTVLMADGTQKPISEITVGEMVITDGGERHPVINVIKNKAPQGLVRVHTAGFVDPVVCTPNHNFLTDCGWISAENLEGKYICMPKVELGEPILSDDDMYAIGLFIAEGSYVKAAKREGILFTLNINERDTFAKWLETYLNTKWSVKSGRQARIREIRHRNTCTVSMNGRDVGRWFFKYCGVYAHSVAIHPSLLFCSNISKLIAGLFDGDGSVGMNRGTPCITYKTISKKLAEQICAVCALLGFQFGFNIHKPKNRKFEQFHLNSYGESARLFANDILGEKISDSGYRYKQRNYYYRQLVHHTGCLVKSVLKEKYNGDVYNLTIQDNHTYIVRNAVVKNCGMNLAFKVKALDHLYFAPMGREIGFQRFADIWMGMRLVEALDAAGAAMVSGYSTVEHRRASNVFSNLEQEAAGIVFNEKLWDTKAAGTITEAQRSYFHFYNKCLAQWKAAILEIKQAMPKSWKFDDELTADEHE